MKKSDLRNGMVVVCRNGMTCFVFNNRLLCNEGYIKLDSYTEDLTDRVSCFDITKVYSGSTLLYNISDLLIPGELLWERKETPVLIHGKYYVQNDQYIFRFAGYTKDILCDGGYEDTIWSDMFVNVNSKYSSIGRKCIIGSEHELLIREATYEEIEELYKACLKQNNIYFLESQIGNRYIFSYKCIIGGEILFNKVYDFDGAHEDKAGELINIEFVKNIRPANTEELAAYHNQFDKKEMTIAEIESKLGMQSGTLRIKK